MRHSNTTAATSNYSEESSSTTNSPLLIGMMHSDKACVLDPPWGMPSKWSPERACTGRPVASPFSTAKHLTCDDKPSKIDRSDSGLTVALLHFANPSMLRRQLDSFASYPVDIQKQLTILIIDDGSPQGLRAKEYISDHIQSSHFRIRIALITTDLAWNIGGARNLAFHIVDTWRVLLLDLDMIVPIETMQAVLTWETRNSTHIMAHKFNRLRPNGKTGRHPAVSLLDVEAYWESGGCDEDFCGRYGFTDVHFWKRWQAKKGRVVLNKMKMFIVEVEQNACDATFITSPAAHQTCIESFNGLQLPSKNSDPNRQLIMKKIQTGCWSPSYLRFAWMIQL